MVNTVRWPATVASVVVAAGLTLAACGQGSAPATSSQASQPASTAAGPSSAAAKPASGSAGASAATSSDWDTVVAAGKKEGKVSVIGPPGEQVQSALVDAFQKQYGITVDYNAMSGSAATQKVALEWQAGQHNWDVLIAGATGTLVTLIPLKAIAPIDPQLILPEVKDPKNWRGGALPVIGPNHEIFVMTPYQRGTLFYNKTQVKDDEIKSYKDLLDPKWTGKMQMDDPRRPGPGQATFIFFYLHPDLGESFIRALGKQNITIQNDYQQEIDIVGQGKTPLLIGGVDYLAEGRMKQGAPIGIVPPTQLKEGTDVSAASGDVSVMNSAPHPNAAKAYVNWLLTKDAQVALAKANDFTDSRVDVNADWTESWRLPQPNAIRTDGDVAVQTNPKLIPLLKEVFGSS